MVEEEGWDEAVACLTIRVSSRAVQTGGYMHNAVFD